MSSINQNSPLNYPINAATPINRVAANRPPVAKDARGLKVGDEFLDESANAWYKLSPGNVWTLLGGASGGPVQSFIPQSGVSPVEPNVAGQITLSGRNGLQTIGAINTVFFEPSISGFPITPFVVGPSGQAGYQTIQSAINAASSTKGSVFIQPGTYTENLVMADGVQLIGATGISQIENDGVRLVGTITPPDTGHFVVRNLHISSATSIFTSNTAGNCHIHIIDCESNVTDGWLFNLPNWTGTLEIENYNPASPGVNDGGINNTGGATILLFNAGLGVGTGRTMVISGPLIMEQGEINCPVTFGAGSELDIQWMTFNSPITTTGNCTGTIFASSFNTGANSCIIHNATQQLFINTCALNSSNVAYAIDGSGIGTLQLTDIAFVYQTGISPALNIENIAGINASTGFYAIQPGSGQAGLYIRNNTITVISDIDADVALTGNGTGSVSINSQYKLPSTSGSNGQVLTYTGGGNTAWQTPSSAALTVNTQVFTSSGTYTPTANMKYCTIELVGGGGGGAGCATGVIKAVGGGGAGGYSKATIDAATIGVSQTVTIGAAGSGGATGNNAGTNGGTTSVGALISATGGVGAVVATSPITGALGGVGSSGQLNSNGQSGGVGVYTQGTTLSGMSGCGGNSYFGGGAPSSVIISLTALDSNVDGTNATGYGSGGSGGVSAGTGTASGGNGSAGIVIITEYIQ